MVTTTLGRVAALVLFLGCSSAAGADDDRARKAKVALALAGVTPTPAAAPAPRPAGKLSYPEGYQKAATEQQPLVVFVGCDGPRPAGAIISKADGPFAGVTGPAVVVGYPVGQRLYIDATIPCPADETMIQKAVEAARRKIDATPPAKVMPAAPKPLDWQIRGPAAGPACDT